MKKFIKLNIIILIIISLNHSVVQAANKKTGVYKAEYTQDGKTTTEWCYLVDGKVQYNYYGFASNKYGWFYIEKGKVNFNKRGIIRGKVKKQTGYWFVFKGKVQFIDTVEKYNNKMFCVRNGKIDFNYTGFASNKEGVWYCKNGQVNISKKDVIKGNVKGKDGWWYVCGGKVQFIDSVEKNANGWWVIKKGKVDFNYTGFAQNSSGWWYCKKGKVDFNENSVIKGIVDGENGYWLVKNGKVHFINSVEKYMDDWWFVYKGRINFYFTGFAKNANGWWFVHRGKVDFSMTEDNLCGSRSDGQTDIWNIKNGKVVSITNYYSQIINVDEYKKIVYSDNLTKATYIVNDDYNYYDENGKSVDYVSSYEHYLMDYSFGGHFIPTFIDYDTDGEFDGGQGGLYMDVCDEVGFADVPTISVISPK